MFTCNDWSFLFVCFLCACVCFFFFAFFFLGFSFFGENVEQNRRKEPKLHCIAFHPFIHLFILFIYYYSHTYIYIFESCFVIPYFFFQKKNTTKNYTLRQVVYSARLFGSIIRCFPSRAPRLKPRLSSSAFRRTDTLSMATRGPWGGGMSSCTSSDPERSVSRMRCMVSGSGHKRV